MAWFPPDDYRPIRGVAAYVLSMDTPPAGSAEEKLRDMIIHCRNPRETGLTAEMARKLIDRRIVTTGLYPNILAVALGLT